MRSKSDITTGQKALVALVAAAVNAIVYLVPNHVLLRTPVHLPWTSVDAAVPFVPVTLWIYFSDYLLIAGAFMLCRSWDEAKRFSRAYLALLVVGSSVHLLWPTIFPRDQFPLPDTGLTAFAFSLLRQVDYPTSCLPSMHVAGSCLAAFSLWRHPRWLNVVWVSWATAVAVSTLTAKQHYAVDVLAGLALATLFWALFFWLPAGHPHPRSHWGEPTPV